MARLPLFTALQAAVGPTECGMVGPDTPARPDGTVIWAHCAAATHLSTVQTLASKLTEDGEMITIIATLPHSADPHIQISPNTKRSSRAFLDHWKPQIVLWFGGGVEPTPLAEIKRVNIPAIFVEANSFDFEYPKAPRLPRKSRAALGVFTDVLTVDDVSTARLIKMGANPKTTRTLGMLEDGIAPPPHNEAERADLVETLQTRPIWLAADVPMAELSVVVDAHRQAERRAHRTLLVLVPRDIFNGPKMAELLRENGFTVACRSADDALREAAQIYVADTDDGLGLWCRLSPITYLGGSMTDGIMPDPFAPATVGSAVLVGPSTAQFQSNLDRLITANALHLVASPTELGGAIELLLAADYAAQLAHAAWDVTSRGADATNDLVTLIYTYLDKVDG